MSKASSCPFLDFVPFSRQAYAALHLNENSSSEFIIVQVHERNSLTMSDSVMLGSSLKFITMDLKENEVESISFEVLSKKLVRYPRKSRPLCKPS